jgi:hypothetical protein
VCSNYSEHVAFAYVSPVWRYGYGCRPDRLTAVAEGDQPVQVNDVPAAQQTGQARRPWTTDWVEPDAAHVTTRRTSQADGMDQDGGMRSGPGSTGVWVWGTVGVVLLLVSAVWPTAWLLGKTDDDDGSGIANVLALPLTALSLAAGVASVVVGLRSRLRVDDPAVLGSAARELLRAVTKGEAATLQQLLGDSGMARPADVGFVQPEAGVRWRSDRGASSGSLGEVATYYQSLQRGRLVVLGEPGAGKTVLAVRLLLDLAMSTRADLTRDQMAWARVPIRLNLSSFIVPEHLHSASDLHERFEGWIAEHVAGYLSGNRRRRAAVARALVADGWVLPILDGLDEMDSTCALPQRARRVLVALNQPSGDTPCPPLVLTCRRDSYRYLAQHAPDEAYQGNPSARWVEDATVIILQPLKPNQITAWLAHRFPDPSQANKIQARWRRVVATIERRPGGRLAKCFSSPLRLYLTCAVYADPDSKPAQLCGLGSDALNRHLLNHLIPATTRHYPRPDGTHYHPDNVTHWLATLAHHLTTMASLGQSGTDIHLHHLWAAVDAPPSRRIRFQATALSVFPLVLLIVVMVRLPMTKLSLLESPRGTFITYLIAGILILYVIHKHYRADLHRSPRRLDIGKLRDPNSRHLLITVFIGGLVAGIVLGVVAALAVSPPTQREVVFALAFTGGVTGGIFGGLTTLLTSAQDAARHPSEPLRQTITGVLAVGLTGGLVAWLSSMIVYGPTWQGLTLALAFALALAPSGVDPVPVLPRYLLATRTLYRAGRLPRHPARFLDWAHTAGLVRLAGAATQFRHQDIQEHFNDHPPCD